jgi:hypothetical protein
MRGRYPAGLEYIDKVEGSALAKERARAILATISGELRWLEACARLGIRETRLHQLRQEALQALVGSLEPGTAGRPSLKAMSESQRIRELEQALTEKELEVEQALVRAEVALIVPHAANSNRKKKRRASAKLRKQKPR